MYLFSLRFHTFCNKKILALRLFAKLFFKSESSLMQVALQCPKPDWSFLSTILVILIATGLRKNWLKKNLIYTSTLTCYFTQCWDSSGAPRSLLFAKLLNLFTMICFDWLSTQLLTFTIFVAPSGVAKKTNFEKNQNVSNEGSF